MVHQAPTAGRSAADVQPPTPGCVRHRERGRGGMTGGGELLHPAVALVSDPDVTERGDRQRDRWVRAGRGRRLANEDGQHPAEPPRLDNPVVARVRDPVTYPRVGKSVAIPAGWSRFLPKVAAGHQTGRARDAVVPGVGYPNMAAGRIAGKAAGLGQRDCPKARRKGGACASGLGGAADTADAVRASTDDPGVNEVATSMPRHTRRLPTAAGPRRREQGAHRKAK